MSDETSNLPPTWNELGASFEEWDAYGSIITVPGLLDVVWMDRRCDGLWDRPPAGYLVEFGNEGRVRMSDEDVRREVARRVDGVRLVLDHLNVSDDTA